MINSEHDPFGLLELENSKEKANQFLTPLLARFTEIEHFVESELRSPDINSSGYERQLASVLVTIANRSDLRDTLKNAGYGNKLDQFLGSAGMLNQQQKVLVDPFGLLAPASSTGVQRLRHIKKVERTPADEIAKREKCSNFKQFAELFHEAVKLLDSGALVPSTNPAGKIKQGSFVIVSNLMAYVAEIDTQQKTMDFSSGTRDRVDGRTLIIFENGTQSKMLLRSLEKAIQSDGFLLEQVQDVPKSNEDSAGFLYVVESTKILSTQGKPVYKIGFTRNSVEQRLARAKTEAAYLFGDVKVSATYRCIGVDPGLLEKSLHEFFREARLDISIDIGSGNFLNPKEWFQLDLDSINRAIYLALDSELQNYTYSVKDGILSSD